MPLPVTPQDNVIVKHKLYNSLSKLNRTSCYTLITAGSNLITSMTNLAEPALCRYFSWTGLTWRESSGRNVSGSARCNKMNKIKNNYIFNIFDNYTNTHKQTSNFYFLLPLDLMQTHTIKKLSSCYCIKKMIINMLDLHVANQTCSLRYWMQSLPVFSVSTTMASMFLPRTLVMARVYLTKKMT